MSLYFGVIGNRDYIKYRGRRLPFWEFLDRQPDGWLCSLAYRRGDVPDHTTRIWDCGAWSYRDLDIPSLNGAVVTPAWAWEQYRKLAHEGDFVVAPDHMLIPGVDVAFRREYNRSSACEFLRLTQEMPCLRPMAVAHGMNVPEKVRTALELYEIGYRALALGGLAGMAGQKPNSVIAAVQEVRAAIPDAYLHVLGVSSPSFAAEWNYLGVDSFDGASCFKQAFTAGAFYLEREGSLVAYRAARPGEDVTVIPLCDCRACRLLREDGVDTRQYGSNETNMGRAAHNLNQLMRALKYVKDNPPPTQMSFPMPRSEFALTQAWSPIQPVGVGNRIGEVGSISTVDTLRESGSANRDCLVVECSARKRDPRQFPHVLGAEGVPMAPAWNVYDGNQVRVVRKYAPYRDLDILILSAQFGLLTPRHFIPLYSRRMDWARARDKEWIEQCISEAWEWITDAEPGRYTTVYHSLNRVYERALRAGLREFGIESVSIAPGYASQGRRLSALRDFCQARHDPTAVIHDRGGVPEIVGFQLQLA